MRVLFLQQQPCVRAISTPSAWRRRQIELGFAYRGRTLTELYGAGDELFETWYPLGDDPAAALREIVELPAGHHPLAQPPGRAHRAGARQRRVPVIHDVHDMQSLRRTPYEDGFPEPAGSAGARASGDRGVGRAGDDLARAAGGAGGAPHAAAPRAWPSPTTRLGATCRASCRRRGRRAAAARLPGHAVDQRRPLRPARPVRRDRRAGDLARRLHGARGARVPRDPGHPRPRPAAATALLRRLPSTTSAGRASTPASTAPTSTPRCPTSSTSTSAAGCR